jgi:hypothetical protein
MRLTSHAAMGGRGCAITHQQSVDYGADGPVRATSLCFRPISPLPRGWPRFCFGSSQAVPPRAEGQPRENV